MEKYDLIIIGGGPAGLTAAIYAVRYKLKTLLIAKELGGYMMESDRIENYPGFKKISGLELTEKMADQAKSLGAKIEEDEAIEIKKDKEFMVTTRNNKFEAKTLIYALGTQRRKLNVPGEEQFLGKGISYCATCDGPFFKDKIVAVVGGSDAAAIAALQVAEHAKKVYIIYRKEKLRAEPYWVDQLEKNKKFEIICNANVKEIKGTGKLESISLDNGKELKLDGLFVEIGSVPTVALAEKIGLELSEENYIKIHCDQSTNVSGIFAAGDITIGCNSMRQIITAAAEGAIAARAAYDHLSKKR
jgi:thioredoxin reductase (NADPH)